MDLIDQEIEDLKALNDERKIREKIIQDVQEVIENSISIPTQQTRLRHSINQTLDEINLLDKNIEDKTIRKYLRNYIRKNSVQFDFNNETINGIIILLASIIKKNITQ